MSKLQPAMRASEVELTSKIKRLQRDAAAQIVCQNNLKFMRGTIGRVNELNRDLAALQPS